MPASLVNDEITSRWHEEDILQLTALGSAIDDGRSTNALENDLIHIEKSRKDSSFSVTFSSTASVLKIHLDEPLESPEIASSSQGINSRKAMFRSRHREVIPERSEETREEFILPGAVSVVPNNAACDNDSTSDEEFLESRSPVSAELVDEAQLLHDERERIREEVLRKVSNQAVEGDVVKTLADPLKKRHRALFSAALIFLICLAVVVAVVLTVSTQSSPDPSITSEIFPSTSPTMTLTPSYIDQVSAFRTTEELYEAVDSYFLAYKNGTTLNATAEFTPDVILRYGPIGAWNVSQITNFSRVFDPERNFSLSWDSIEYYLLWQLPYDTIPTAYDPRRFNEDLSEWDVSNAETMMGMFARADSFVGFGLEKWNVGKVKDFSFMFMGASLFKGNISKWNTSSAEFMECMFIRCFAWDDNLSEWDVSRVVHLRYMFFFAESFLGDGLENWNVSQATTMNYMFADAGLFNGDVSAWDTSSLLVAEKMFINASSFNHNLSAWDMSKVSSTAGMFASSYKFNGDVSTWDMSNNRDYTGMFKNCVSFSQDLAAWNVRNAESFRDMFSGAGLFAGKGLSNWSVSEWLHDSAYMFLDATSFNGNISSWDVSRVQFMESMFAGATTFNQDLSLWDISNVQDASAMFLDAESFQQDLCSWENLLSESALVYDMFTDSGCLFPVDPFSNGTSSFFCSECLSSAT